MQVETQIRWKDRRELQAKVELARTTFWQGWWVGLRVSLLTGLLVGWSSEWKKGLLMASKVEQREKLSWKYLGDLWNIWHCVILKLRQNFEAQGREGWTDLWVDSDQLRCGLNQRLGNRSWGWGGAKGGLKGWAGITSTKRLDFFSFFLLWDL